MCFLPPINRQQGAESENKIVYFFVYLLRGKGQVSGSKTNPPRNVRTIEARLSQC
jgi:hypothetical protein